MKHFHWTFLHFVQSQPQTFTVLLWFYVTGQHKVAHNFVAEITSQVAFKMLQTSKNYGLHLLKGLFITLLPLNKILFESLPSVVI